MRRTFKLAFLPLLAAALATHAAPPGAERSTAEMPRSDGQLIWTPCRLPGFDEMLAALPSELAEHLRAAGDGRCTTIEVFEDRTAARGRRIPLRIAVLPATGSTPRPDPIYAITGGPGGSIVASPWITLILEAARSERDVVLADQRGTGGSNPLACGSTKTTVAEVFGPMLPAHQVESCRRKLERHADLKLYTSDLAADDLDEVRRVLGHDKINLWGGSYGSYVAQMFLRRHPEAARSAVLSGPSPLDSRPPLMHAAWGQEALDRLLQACARDRACHRAFPDPAADLQTVMRRLAEQPARLEVTDPRNDERHEVELHRGVFAEALRGLLYQAEQAVQIPQLLAQAAAGDFSAFAREVITRELMNFQEGDNWFSGMFLSVGCSEFLAFITPEEATRRTAGTFLGTYRIDRQRQACAGWPRGDLPADFHQPVRSSVPVLLLVGELDPVTPPTAASAIAEHLENSRVIVLPSSGHSPTDLACNVRLIAEFFAEGAATDLDDSCVAKIQLPPWAGV